MNEPKFAPNKVLINEYQCPGCLLGHTPENCSSYKPAKDHAGCGAHIAGTILAPFGKIFLGLPKGFNRLGRGASFHEKLRDMPVEIFSSWEDLVLCYGEVPSIESLKKSGEAGKPYNIFNIPVWKHLDKNGNTLVRGIRPRINEPFLHIIAGDHRDKLDCLEISQQLVEEMS